VRYQIRLIDQDLPGLTRELALACWQAVDVLLPERPGVKVYRSLYRAFRGVLGARVQAFRFCGAARSCEQSLVPTELGTTEWQERFPPEPERIRRYLVGSEAPPAVLVYELLREALRAVVGALPKRKLKGLSRFLRRQIEKILKGRVYGSEWCTGAPLCRVNEPTDPWARAQ
jgi:hypothetical protein